MVTTKTVSPVIKNKLLFARMILIRNEGFHVELYSIRFKNLTEMFLSKEKLKFDWEKKKRSETKSLYVLLSSCIINFTVLLFLPCGFLLERSLSFSYLQWISSDKMFPTVKFELNKTDIPYFKNWHELLSILIRFRYPGILKCDSSPFREKYLLSCNGSPRVMKPLSLFKVILSFKIRMNFSSETVVNLTRSPLRIRSSLIWKKKSD